MTRTENRTWYRIALAKPGEPTTLVAAHGEHLGAAIATAEHQRKGAYAVAAALADGSTTPLGESVGKDHVVALGEVADIPAFHWPPGVVPELAHAHELASIRRGFAVHPDPELLVIEAVTDAENLTDLFLGLVEKLPAADNLEVRVLDHFEDTGETEVWLTSRVDAKKIIRFLDDHDVELLGNGHLELSIYVRKHEATLRLTEHKTVVWLAKPGELSLEADVIGWLGELGEKRVDPLLTIAKVPHFHTRPAKSRDRKKLVEHLYRQRLRRVDTVREVRDTAETDG
ncbi:MAG TPA: hypothetical protein VIU61_12795 [Kofleriaceae bacterium]